MEPTNVINIAILPEVSADIELQHFTHSSTGAKATPAKLLKIVLNRLDSGVCIFIFKKKDGAYRKAIGTRHEPSIPGTREPAAMAASDTKTNFWDIEVNEWKSFTNDSVVAVIIF